MPEPNTTKSKRINRAMSGEVSGGGDGMIGPFTDATENGFGQTPHRRPAELTPCRPGYWPSAMLVTSSDGW